MRTRRDHFVRRSITLIFVLVFLSVELFAAQINIPAPAGSERFGYHVRALGNGNIVVSDPFWDAPGPIQNVGAVFLYNGADGSLISTLTGSSADDLVGNGIEVLPNGNFVVVSSLWDGAVSDVGAVTWCNGLTGLNGVVSAANSLVGGTASDQIGSSGVIVLANGNFVVNSPTWNGTASQTGAVTWVDGTTGLTGPVSVANSLVGSTAGDSVGSNGITALSNGNYLVHTGQWDGSASDVGAITFGPGATGIVGPVSAANSLVGSNANDFVGWAQITELANGNYVVANFQWNGTAPGAGSVTFGNGTTGVSGVVSASNSLVGSSLNDNIGSAGVTPLANGNYVVSSPRWDQTWDNVGAVTFGNGDIGISGAVSSSNSLVGSAQADEVGRGGAVALTNGNYVVVSPVWDGTPGNEARNVGAVTFANGATGMTGTVSASNSLVGSTAGDNIGDGPASVMALTNGNYVVSSPQWNGTAADVGAATWVDGTTGMTGPVSASNSLIGSTAGDRIGAKDIVPLKNGNYVVVSPEWDGTAANVGAVTWGNGNTGIVGPVSHSNSLVGTTAEDQIGSAWVTPLANGSYVVGSTLWNGTSENVGAVTFGNGLTGISGPVSVANSLVGSSANDEVGSHGITSLMNGNYVVSSAQWDGTALDVGALTFGNGTTGSVGNVSASNSLTGSTAGDQVGSNSVIPLTDGSYYALSSEWDNGVNMNAGAVSYLSGTTGEQTTKRSHVGTRENGRPNIGVEFAIDQNNSVLGTTAKGGSEFRTEFDAFNNQLIVGRPRDGIVTLFARFSPLFATVSGRVIDLNGNGVPKARVSISNLRGDSQSTLIGPFGHFSFPGLQTGRLYRLSVAAKGREFNDQEIFLGEGPSSLLIVAQ